MAPGKLVAQTLPDVDFHKAVGAMGQYPKLLRALGLAIDLRIPLDAIAAATTGGNIRVTPHLDGAAPITPWTAFVLDRAAAGFTAGPGPDADVANAMIDFSGPDRYDVVEVDVDGAAEKVLDFATNLARVAYGNNTTIDTPDRYGLPALRSAGFSAARSGRAVRLVDTFARMKQHNANVTADPRSPQVVLHADDITRGYRIDVWDSASGEWHSLSQRDGRYDFRRGTPQALSRSYSDEGFATLATTDGADGSGGDLRLPESLFRWAGWSLCVRRAGRTIGSDSNPADPANAATTDFQLETSFTVTKGSLPRLRFGTQYQFRARAVDLAGNSLAPDDAIDDAYSIPSQPHVLPEARAGGRAGGRPARSPRSRHHARRVARPPRDPEQLRHEHRGFVATAYRAAQDIGGDGGNTRHAGRRIRGPRQGGVRAAGGPGRLVRGQPHRARPGGTSPPSRSPAGAALPARPVVPGSGVLLLAGDRTGHGLEDPVAGRVARRAAFPPGARRGIGTAVVCRDRSRGGADRSPAQGRGGRCGAQLVLDRRFVDDTAPATLDVGDLGLDRAGAAAQPFPAAATGARRAPLDADAPRTLTLVHAVQQPLIEPQFQHLTAARDLGSTSAVLTDELPISGKSTDKIDVEASWTEPVDDGTDGTQPVLLSGAARAFEQTLEKGDTVAVLDGIHEFHDTKHRTVSYTAVAATRFREYFPAAITADRAKITRTSVPEVVSVPSSARPPAPKVLYVLPTFAWTDRTEGAWNLSRRGGGGLRVYLDRPWYSSGEGELLGAVLWACEPPQHDQFDGYSGP